MKRFLTLLLMLWLPLFMQSAWAMSTRMTLENMQTDVGRQANQDEASGPAHCHGSVDKTSVAQTDAQPSAHHHHCAHCMACTIATASASFDTAPKFYLPDFTQEISSSALALYLSIYLSAEVEPPISA